MFEAILAYIQANAVLTVVYIALVTAITFAVNDLAERVARWRIEREEDEDYVDFDTLNTTME